MPHDSQLDTPPAPGAEPTLTFTGQVTRIDPLAVRLSRLARELQSAGTVEETLEAVARAAADTVPGARHAGITEPAGRRGWRTTAATDDLVRQVDDAQYATGQGPCLTALAAERLVHLPDTGVGGRWPEFNPRASGLGVGSMMSVRLYLARDSFGALNMYAPMPHAFDAESEGIGLLLATHAAVAIGDARRVAQLNRALDVRDLIGQAKGILMERHRLTGEQAFGRLVAASQRCNVKLVEVAHRLVETGELPASG
ncbi:GAF and ANTAR domain-containing protein [Micromonospora sp. CPCC 205711]|uniref:GAF and ANTAR domain-containing protein n=1 Tax=Micromonospora sp. CPCC 205547 TaxID=3122400 RepID=UPI002FF2628A